MGLKSIDMQMAISRSQDASRMQDQFNRQGQQLQAVLSEQQLQEVRLKRQQVNQYEHVEKRSGNEDGHNNPIKLHESNEHINKMHHEKQVKITHPYIGKHIDFTG